MNASDMEVLQQVLFLNCYFVTRVHAIHFAIYSGSISNFFALSQEYFHDYGVLDCLVAKMAVLFLYFTLRVTP